MSVRPERPAYFGGPLKGGLALASRVHQPHFAEETPARCLPDHKYALAQHRPVTHVPQQAMPDLLTREGRPTRTRGNLWISPYGRAFGQILRLRGDQDKTRGCQG